MERCGSCGAALAEMALSPTRRWLSSSPRPSAAEDLLDPGTDLGGYRVEGLLGQGGMGVVYRAVQSSLGRPVALKVLARRLAQDESFVRRFDREAVALAGLNHPNIVAIYDKGTSQGRYFFAMELVDGVSLRRILMEKPLSPAEALSAMPDLCSALEYAHGCGVLHRDIKPENLLVSRGGRIKIADFGLARLVGQESSAAGSLTQAGTLIGTRDYMAPETRQSSRQDDHRADLYSLGVVLYEMLTGELPIGRFPLPSQKCGVDVSVDEVVLKALEPDPARRWQKASEISEALTRTPAQDTAGAASLVRAQALASLERPSTLTVTPTPLPPASSSGQGDGPLAPALPETSSREGMTPRFLARRPGEARRRWKARVGALTFLGLALLTSVTILAFLPPRHRPVLAVPLGGAALVAAWAWWLKRPRG